jgi:ABC-2 type transport system ATP-binding protein
MISARGISRSFGDRVAVEDVTFEVGRGEVFGLLGPNGAGKTTTLRMLGGLIPPSAGSIAIAGRPFTRATAGALRAGIGFLTETPGLWDHLTVADNLQVYARLFAVPRPAEAAQRVLRLFTLWDRRDDRVALLSKGMKQKLALARALVHDPEVLLLDEPTANLDPQTARLVRDLLIDLRRQGRAVVVSTHNLDEIERLADRVALVSRRLIAIGTPLELRRTVFGHRLHIRLAGSALAEAFAGVATSAGATGVRADGHELSLALESPETDAPAVVRALVNAGAAVREVFDEQRTLEDVYLELLDSGRGSA